jgi:glycosyltransferase involved in cell wall biosynthesis
MKKVCLDLRALQIGHENRGIGMYIRSVLENLPNDDDIEYIFYSFDSSDPIKKLGIETQKYTLVQTKTLKTSLDSPKNILSVIKLVGHRFTPLRGHKINTFIQFDFMLGMPHWRGTKKIAIGYDLIPLIMKNEYMPTLSFIWHHSFGKKAKLRGVLRSIYYKMRYHLHYKVFKRADEVLCISNYVFYIGGTDTRKKVVDIIRAFNIANGRGKPISLVLAGNEFTDVETMPDILARKAIKSSPYRQNIHLVGFVSDQQKIQLYRSARAFIFASTHEGFGLPIIEAMSESCPVITYNNSSIPEAAGKAALMVRTGDFVGIANSIIELEDSNKIKALTKKGLRQASLFSWSRYMIEFRKSL